MKIDRALKEIHETREHLDMLEKWLNANANKFEHGSVIREVTTSLNLTPTQIFVYAGNLPKVFARQFGGACQIRGNSWEMKFKDFQITMMEAAEEERVIL